MRIYTIGAYGHTEQSFIQRLKDAKIDRFLDVRRRRGMRGGRYSFLNSLYLQRLMRANKIEYVHAAQFAPTENARAIQKHADKASHSLKRDREHLSEEFVQMYLDGLHEISLEKIAPVVSGAQAIVLFCVEFEPLACHRALAASYLARLINGNDDLENLMP